MIDVKRWVLVLLATGCTQGATPDCAQVRCGPDLDGAVPGDGASDASSDANDASAVDAGDAAQDGGSKDSPSG